MNTRTASFALVVVVAFLGPRAAHADTVTIKYKGKILTGGTVGGVVEGSVKFPDNLPDLIAGGLEDWWQAAGFVDFTFQGNGIDFATTSGSLSELRIKDRPEQDALRYDGVSGSTSLLLLLTAGTIDGLLTGSGGLTGSIPRLTIDVSRFQPCTATEPSGFQGSCSQFATSAGAMLFNLTELSIGLAGAKELLSKLVNEIIALNLKAGLSNSFDAKLDAVMAAIDDTQEQNDVAAINALYAFINAVNAQRGIHLTTTQADLLISKAHEIITELGG